MSDIYVFAFTAALNPTLLGATTVMLLLDHPKRLLLGYLCGAILTSVTLGLLIVFELDGSSGATSTTQNTLSPAANFALAGILLAVAYVIRPGHVRREEGRLADRRRRRQEAKKEKGPPRWQTALSKGTARTTFVIGAILTLPGASYLAGLHHIADQNASTAGTIGLVLSFNLIMLMLLELPLIGYTFAPEWTQRTIDRFRAWFNGNAKTLAFGLAAGLAILLIVRGAAELI